MTEHERMMAIRAAIQRDGAGVWLPGVWTPMIPWGVERWKPE